MKAAKYCVLSVIFGLLVYNAYAGAKLPVSAATGEVTYRQTYKLQANFTDDDAYALIQNWFKADAAAFTCQNGGGPNVSSKNKSTVEDEFNNPHPLQTLDPASGRITGKGLIKYFGGAGSAIGALYMEYYLVVEINGNQLTATITQMKYHHYNERTYAQKPIYLWQGGRPFDAADKLENLVNGPVECKDIQDVGTYVNSSISGLFSNLQFFLQTQKILDASQLTRSVASDN